MFWPPDVVTYPDIDLLPALWVNMLFMPVTKNDWFTLKVDAIMYLWLRSSAAVAWIRQEPRTGLDWLLLSGCSEAL